eukprot:scaffold2630_cov118-Isochrysis_galbana.AAC.5
MRAGQAVRTRGQGTACSSGQTRRAPAQGRERVQVAADVSREDAAYGAPPGHRRKVAPAARAPACAGGVGGAGTVAAGVSRARTTIPHEPRHEAAALTHAWGTQHSGESRDRAATQARRAARGQRQRLHGEPAP